MEVFNIFFVLFVAYLNVSFASSSSEGKSSGCSAPRAASTGGWDHIVENRRLTLRNDDCEIQFDGVDPMIDSLSSDFQSVLLYPNACPNPKLSDERRSSQTGGVTEVTGRVDTEKGSVELICHYGTREIQYSTSSNTIVNPLNYDRSFTGAIRDFFTSRVIADRLHRSVAKKYCHELRRMEDRFLDSLNLAILLSRDGEARKYWSVPLNWQLLNTRFEIGQGYIEMFDQGLLMVSLPVQTGKVDTRASVFNLDFEERLQRFNIRDSADQATILDRFFRQGDLFTSFQNTEPSRSLEDFKVHSRRAFVSDFKGGYIRVRCYDSESVLVGISHLRRSAFTSVHRNTKRDQRAVNRIHFDVDISRTSRYIPDIEIITFNVCRNLEDQSKILKNVFANLSAKFITSRYEEEEGLHQQDYSRSESGLKKRPVTIHEDNNRVYV